MAPVTRDPRYAKTLGEACDNGDGTYSGARALAWLSEVLAPGKGVAAVDKSDLTRLNLRTIADELQAALTSLNDNPTDDAMRVVNGKWARAVLLLDHTTPKGPSTTGGAGLKKGAKLREVA